MTHALAWLFPALSALTLYGVGQGFVKKYISEVPPARFCLFFVVAKALVNFSYYFSQPHPELMSVVGDQFFYTGLLAYVFDGIGWICYFQSIVHGPITIVGTLSAAYPATTILIAWAFLGEVLEPLQYAGVVLVIVGCVGLAWAPSDGSVTVKSRSWILWALGALLIWGVAQNLVKFSYNHGGDEGTLSILNTLGGFLTLGLYGILHELRSKKDSHDYVAHNARQWLRSFLPMGMMAGGDLGVIIATRYGPVSIVTPLTGAYPMVTLLFAWFVLKEKILWYQWIAIGLILGGIFLSPGSSG